MYPPRGVGKTSFGIRSTYHRVNSTTSNGNVASSTDRAELLQRTTDRRVRPTTLRDYFRGRSSSRSTRRNAASWKGVAWKGVTWIGENASGNFSLRRSIETFNGIRSSPLCAKKDAYPLFANARRTSKACSPFVTFCRTKRKSTVARCLLSKQTGRN